MMVLMFSYTALSYKVRLKLQVGDDSLQYVMARSDTIPALHMFRWLLKSTFKQNILMPVKKNYIEFGFCRNHLEPVWLFVASGQGNSKSHTS